MPQDFRSFKQQYSKNDQSKVNEYKTIYDKYKDMNSDDLMSNLLSEAGKLRNQGKLDNNTLNQLSTSLSPLLNEDQRKMLSTLVNTIKEQ